MTAWRHDLTSWDWETGLPSTSASAGAGSSTIAVGCWEVEIDHYGKWMGRGCQATVVTLIIIIIKVDMLIIMEIDHYDNVVMACWMGKVVMKQSMKHRFWGYQILERSHSCPPWKRHGRIQQAQVQRLICDWCLSLPQCIYIYAWLLVV